MKRLTIYKRTILEKTRFKKYPFKEVTQYKFFFDGKEYKNHDEDINNPRLKVKFEKILETRSTEIYGAFIGYKLGRTDADKWLKLTLLNTIH